MGSVRRADRIAHNLSYKGSVGSVSVHQLRTKADDDYNNYVPDTKEEEEEKKKRNRNRY